MIDLNDVPQQRSRVNLGALETALRDYADRWIPELFPQGWRSDSGDEWCVGDISGKRPAGNGSCRIKLNGPNAGDHFDFSLQRGGQVFSTIKERLKLGQGEVVREALRIVAECGVDIERAVEHKRPPRQPQQSRAAEHNKDAAFEWSKRKPLIGTVGEQYLVSRGLRVPATNDLAYSDECVDFQTMLGMDAVLALFRFPDGTPSGGIHRIYLKPDASKHARKMLGVSDGAVVMLGQPARGLLGIAEGIETTIAAMMLFNVSGWAAGSAGGLVRFGEWLKANPGWAGRAGIRRLLIWADARRAGEDAGLSLLESARIAGVDAQLWLPQGGDDFNDDLLQGLRPVQPAATTHRGMREPGEEG